MAGDVDDVIGTGHHEDLASLVDVSSVSGQVVTGERIQVGGWKRSSAIQRVGEEPGGMGNFATSAPVSPRGSSAPSPSSTRRSPARHGTRRRSGNDWKALDTEAVRGHGPAGLCLPPVVDHRHTKLAFRPVECLRIATLSSEEERAEAGQVVALDVSPSGSCWRIARKAVGGREEC